MAVMTQAQTDAELQRKKNLGMAPTSTANNAAYGKLTAQPISASAANAGVTPSQTAGTTKSAQDWINNSASGQGGVDAYTAKQNEKFTTATAANDTNMLKALSADSVRTGLTYGTATPTNTVGAPETKMSSTAQPMSANQANSQPAPDYAALAAARTSLALQQKTTIANQQKTAAQTSYDQQNLRTKDDRVLGDFSRTQTANPFGNMGRTSFQEGLIGRERTQADADASSALATQKGNIDQMLADYQNATEDEKVRIMDELQRADRSYNLDLAKFNQDQSNFDKTYGQNQQQIDYAQSPTNPTNQGTVLNNAGQALTNQLNELKLGNYTTEQKQQATLYDQQVKSGQMSNEAAEYNLKQLKDPNSPSNQAAKIDLQLKQLDLKNAPEKARLEVQQLQKQISQIGVVHYKPQTEAEIAQDKVTLATANKQLTDIANGKYPGDKGDAADYSKDITRISDLYVTPGQYGAAPKVNNPTAMRNAIIALGMADTETDRYLLMYGLPIN